MAVRSSVITVPATAGGILIEDGTSGEAQAPVSVILFVPSGGVTVYLGGPDVTASGAAQGFPVAAGSSSPGFDLFGGDQLYAIVATGSQTVNVLKTRA